MWYDCLHCVTVQTHQDQTRALSISITGQYPLDWFCQLKTCFKYLHIHGSLCFSGLFCVSMVAESLDDLPTVEEGTSQLAESSTTERWKNLLQSYFTGNFLCVRN